MTGRRELPPRRRAETFRMQWGNMRGSFHVTCGYFDDGAIGEVFINPPKVGVPMDGIVRAGAVLASLALQHGASLSSLAAALPREADGSQSTMIGAALTEIMKQGLDTYG